MSRITTCSCFFRSSASSVLSNMAGGMRPASEVKKFCVSEFKGSVL